MAAEYSGDPATSSKDAVRFLIGDDEVVTAPAVVNSVVSDEEIAWVLTVETNTYLAAANIAEILAGRYADKPDKTVGPLSISYGSLGERYQALAKTLRHQARMKPGTPVLTQESKKHIFQLAMHDYPPGTNSLVDPTIRMVDS